MAYEHKPNSGSVFKNEEKSQETHADFAGDGVINGVPMWINVWKNQGKNGTYLKMTFREKTQKAAAPQKPAQKEIIDDDLDF